MKQKQLTKLFSILLSAFMLATNLTSSAQQPKGKIHGQVITQDNKPAQNISILVQGTQNGTVTDENGYYNLRVKAGNYTLILSHVGMQEQKLPVAVTAGQTTNVPVITASISPSALQEVTVNDNKTNKFTRKSSDIVAKMPLADMENPQAYTTISKELLTEQSDFSVDDAIKNSPGIQKMWEATGRGGDGGAYYNMRGFIVQSQLRNGVAGNVTTTVDAANLESIEVIKGPSATLFGSSLTSYGGLINRITKKPYDSFGGELDYSVGSYGLNRVSADVNTPLDPDEKLLFRLNTDFNYMGSWQVNGFTRNGFIAPILTYKATDRLTFTFDGELYYGSGTEKTIYFFPYGGTVAALGASNASQLNVGYNQTYNNGDLVQTSRTANYFGQMSYKFSDHWTSQTNFSSTNSYSNGFGPYLYLVAGNASVARYDQSTANSNDNVTQGQENINGDFRIGTLRNRVVFGLDYYRNNSNQHYIEGYFDNAPDQSSTFNYNSYSAANLNAIYAKTPGYPYPYIFITNTFSAYASDVLNITDRLIALAALRIDRYNNRGNYIPTTQQTTGAYDQTALSPKFGLVYQLVKNEVSLFGNYQNSFTNEPGSDFNGNAFKPEQANQIEGGVKLDIFDGRLSSTVSYYDISVTNIMRADPAHANFNIQNGTQLSKGVEAQVIANPFKGANIVAGFSYNDSKYTNADADVNGLRPATASSPYLANLWLSYRMQQQPVKGLGFGFGGNYASDNIVLNTVSQGQFVLPAYTVLNSAVFFDRPKYRVAFNVNNLTNEKYWIGYSSVNPQMLRQYIATVGFKFK